MSGVPDFQHSLLAAIPQLRAFAIGLRGRTDGADDLVQETLVRAWASQTGFQPGTNLMAWLYTILRNAYYTEFRKHRHEVPDTDGQYAAMQAHRPSQESHIEFQEFRAALAKLPDDQREALLLVGSSGVSYEDAAQICDCALGTMKSRVYRARMRLATMLSVSSTDRMGEDSEWDAVVDAASGASASTLADH
jgi:RNA polymerase sigma-70 factor (ECF subfamily)